MPNRAIKESCRTSPTLNGLSDFAERLFWRLVTVADDFGRFPADPRFLRSECFPLRDDLKTGRVRDAFAELLACQLVTTYVDNCRTYGVFTSWEKHNRRRASHSKYPPPTSDNICQQPTTDSAESRKIPRVERSREPRDGEPPQAAAPAPCPGCSLIIQALNDLTGRNYQINPGNGLHSRHQEHGTAACLRVVSVVGARLLANEKTAKYARPKTLFGPENFPEYLVEAAERPEKSIPLSGSEFSKPRNRLLAVKEPA